MRAAAERLTLPFKRGLRGTSGHVPGAGSGSSIDFQDHRPYVPGDDPRHIDWQAYARSGHYTMKLYREEVQPLADIVLDASASMHLDAAKSRRTWELAWFALESALRAGASVRTFSLCGAQLTVSDALAGWETFSPPATPAHPPEWHRVPWRAASLRLVITDLLFPGAPETFLPALLGGRGRAIVLAPYCAAESSPDWLGNTELVDCEGTGRRDVHFHADDLARYRLAYANHFVLWRTETRRLGVPMVRVDAAGDFAAALCAEGLGAGAVEFV
jgi:uncharacterized protein (DUF58 family)